MGTFNRWEDIQTKFLILRKVISIENDLITIENNQEVKMTKNQK